MAKKKTTQKKTRSSSRKRAIQAQWNEFLAAVRPDAAKAGMTAIEFVANLVTTKLRAAQKPSERKSKS
jgi:predicted secreted Zn-dependent protease